MSYDAKHPQQTVSELAVHDKATLSNATTACDTPRVSDASTPHSDKSGNPFETDIEAMVPTSTTDTCMKALANKRKSDCQVWPDKKDWKQMAKASKKKNRNCACMSKLSQRNRIIAKILIVVLVIGIAVGVGFGVSKPLNAPIWGDDKNS